MLDFDTYLKRYGELGLQSIIEQIERLEGISRSGETTLEARWNVLMQAPYSPTQSKAA